MEGRVLTMNNDAENIFGYSKSEIIGKKRVSIFSPGEIVIQNVGNWLATADKFGEYVGQTYFLKKDGLWCHAKNIEALNLMLREGIHCFWHQEDDVTLTSKGYKWTYPGKQLTENSICVKPELSDEKPKKVIGIKFVPFINI